MDMVVGKVNNNKYSYEKKEKVKRNILFLMRLMILIMGTCCCLQFFVIGIVGVVLGYSIQSYLPFYISLFGSIILVFLGLISKKCIVWGFGFFVLIYLSIIGIQHGKFYYKGEELYGRRQYPEALQEFRKETETWYLRLAYNNYEALSLNMMAKSYCQMGNFNKAIEILSLIAKQYPGISSYIANKEIARIEDALKKINDIDTSSLEENTDIILFYDLARTYKYDLGCDVKAIEIYKRILDMPVEDKFKEEAKKAIQILE